MNQHDKDLEEDVIGILIAYPQDLLEIAPILKVDYLYQNETKAAYKAILSLYENGLPINLGSVTSELKKNSQLDMVGGSAYLVRITRRADNERNGAVRSCYVIHELYILRQLSVLAQEITNAAGTLKADCFEIAERVQKRVADLINIRSEKIKTAGDFLQEKIQNINDVLDGKKATGLLSGLLNLDDLTGGWQPGNLIILAARPGMGKTAFALHLAKYPALTLNKPVGVFSLEMTGEELVSRLAASESNISNTKIDQNKLNRLELSSMGASCVKLSDAPIYIDDTPGLTINQVCAKAKKMFYDHKVELIIVDYLQKMKGTGKGTKEADVSEMSGGLKNLARELNIPIIALAQLNRAVEDREDKRPMLRDLRDSGAIEQDADIVGFLFRPEYYPTLPKTYEFRDQDLSTENLLIFDAAKGRGLDIRELPLKFDREFMQIHNYRLNGQVEKMEVGQPIQANENFLSQS